MRNPVLWGLHNLKKMGPETTCKNPVLLDKLWQKEMTLFACRACLKPNSRGTILPARRAHLCRAAPAQESVLLLHNLAPGEFFETRLTFDRHPPLQLQSISMDTAAVIFMEDLALHSSNWGMREQHNGPKNTIVLGVTTKYISLAFQAPNFGTVVQTDPLSHLPWCEQLPMSLCLTSLQ